jgi:hypothetical protein
MKKLILLLSLSAVLSSCAGNVPTGLEIAKLKPTGQVVSVGYEYNQDVYVDVETDNLYIYGYRGGLCPLYDKEGKIAKYKTK